MSDIEVLFNPACSKCRSVRGILEEKGLDVDYVHYLEQTPSRDDLERVMERLGIHDPREMMRVNEPLYARLELATASRDELLEAMLAHPILIERPIIIRDKRAVIGRPPERVLELFQR